MNHTLGTWIALAGSLAALGCDQRTPERTAAAMGARQLAIAAVERKDYPAAIAAAELASRYDATDPRHLDLVLRLKLEALALDDAPSSIATPMEVETWALLMQQRDPSRWHVYELARAGAKVAKSDLQGAEVHLREALKRAPDLAKAHAILGKLLLEQGKMAEAVPELEAAAKGEPRPSGVSANLGRALIRAGRTPEAISQLLAAIAEHDAADLRLDLSAVLLAQGNLNGAGEQLRKALELDPRNGDAYRRYGEWLLAAGDLKTAELAFANASKLGAEPLATFGMGLTMLRQGKAAQAAPLFEAVARQAPQLLAPVYFAGVSWAEAGKDSAAREWLTGYLQRAGNDPSEAERIKDASARLSAPKAPEKKKP